MALATADASMSGGRRSTDRDSSGRRSVSLPSRYLEELESVSSPGVVSKKAAYFEEAIRFASGEKCRPSSSGKAGGKTMSQVDDSLGEGDSTARTLEFSWDSEEPLASEDSEQSGRAASEEHSGESSGAENEVQPPQLCDSPVVEERREVFDDKSSQSNDNGEEHPELLKENQDPRSEDNDSGKAASKRTTPPKLRDCCQKASVSEKPAASSICHPKVGAKGGPSLRSSCSGVSGTASRLSNPLSRSTNFTRPQPFALSTEKRRQTGTSKVAPGGSEKVVKQNGEESRNRQSVHRQESYSARSLAGRGTSVKAFVLKSDERAEKRKEFYTKLEERMAAREQEKNQMKAKTQDEKEAELRKLRQSLTFKATPMPSFYHTSVEQPKAERKKPPATLTRPVSPKLGREKRGEASKHRRPCQHQRRSPSSSSASSKVSTHSRASKPSPSPCSSPEGMELAEGCSVFLKEEDEAILLPGSV